MTAQALRALLRGSQTVRVHGVWDPVTAALAARAGHRAVHLSGAVTSALQLGLPDLGFVHGTHIAQRAAALVPALRGVPLLADADTGYGNALQAHWTARQYAAAGIAGLHLEDQVAPKRCGHLAGKELADTAVAAAKVRAAADTGIVVVARTDAYSVAGLDEALRRAEAFLAAGADAVFPEGVTDPDELARFAGMPLVINLSEAGGAPQHPDGVWAAAGVRLALQPTTALLAALHAAEQVYLDQPAPKKQWHEFTELVGQNEALELDARYGR